MLHALVFCICLLVFGFFFYYREVFAQKGGLCCFKKAAVLRKWLQKQLCWRSPFVFSHCLRSAKAFPCQHCAAGPGPAGSSPRGSRFAPPLSAREDVGTDATTMPGCQVSSAVGTERVFPWQIPRNHLQGIHRKKYVLVFFFFPSSVTQYFRLGQGIRSAVTLSSGPAPADLSPLASRHSSQSVMFCTNGCTPLAITFCCGSWSARNQAGTLPVSLAAAGGRSSDFCWSFWPGTALWQVLPLGCKAPGLQDGVAAWWVLRDGEGDARLSVPMGYPRGIGGSVVSWLSPSPSAAPDGSCAINREASGCAASPGAVAFSALFVRDVPPCHSLVLGKIPAVGCWRGVQVGTSHLLPEHHQQLGSDWSRADPGIWGDCRGL